MPIRLSTDDVALRERPDYWNFLVSNVLGKLDTIPQKEGKFVGEINYGHLSNIAIATVESTQLRVKRPEKFIENINEDFFKVNLQLKGQATLTQNDRSAILEPGKWVIYDNARPYDLQFHSDYQQLLFLVPRSQLYHRLPTADLWLAKPLSSERGMGKLLFDFVRNALMEGETISGESQAHTAQMLLDMLILGLKEGGEESDHQLTLPKSSRKLQIDQFIRSHLHETELGVGMIAERLHLSKRTIQKMFAEEDTTVNRTIWQQRIERCQLDLRDPRLSNMTVQDIAMSWGFKSNTHFSRVFKEKVGVTPSEFRRASRIVDDSV